jgi:uncharacterized protein YraI
MSEGNQTSSTPSDNGKSNIGLIIAIVVLAIIAVVLIVVVAKALTTDESEGGGDPITGYSTAIPGGATVTASTDVNVRAGPGTQYDVHGVMQQGQTASVVGACQDHSWWAISIPIDAGTGWVSGDYVTPANADNVNLVDCSSAQQPVVPTPEPGQPSVTATVLLNVRSGPGTNNPSYGMLHPGQSAVAVGTNSDGSWYAISVPPAEGGIGWVSAEYVVAENTEGLPVIE